MDSRIPESDGSKAIAAIADVVRIMGPTEQADIDFLLAGLKSMNEGEQRKFVATFRKQIINVAGAEMFATVHPELKP